jgi:myosin protein heavy chain
MKINFLNWLFTFDTILDLLEKSRAIRQAKDERTFHIFYQLLRGASPKDRGFLILKYIYLNNWNFFNTLSLPFLKVEYLLEDMKNYHYLSNTYVQIQGIDEVEEYNNTIKAMHIMGMNNEDIICKLISMKII